MTTIRTYSAPGVSPQPTTHLIQVWEVGERQSYQEYAGVAYFTDAHTAQLMVAQSKGRYYCETVWALQEGETTRIIEATRTVVLNQRKGEVWAQEDRRRAALAKLTPEERTLLGLEEVE